MQQPRHNNRQARKDREQGKKEAKLKLVTEDVLEKFPLKAPITPKTNFQKALVSDLTYKNAIFATAPAGVGKTYVVVSTVVDWLKAGKIKKLILSRPSVGMGNTLGLLPGDIKEKFTPYLMAIIEVITKRYGHGFYETQVNNGNIEFLPLEYVRGRSFEDAVVIVDEFQNTDEETAYTILTRVGENSKIVCMGDVTQTDMKNKRSGLTWVTDFIIRHNLQEVAGVVVGDSDDIVRSDFCKLVVQAREKDLKHKNK